jgi:hypothetical protein
VGLVPDRAPPDVPGREPFARIAGVDAADDQAFAAQAVVRGGLFLGFDAVGDAVLSAGRGLGHGCAAHLGQPGFVAVVGEIHLLLLEGYDVIVRGHAHVVFPPSRPRAASDAARPISQNYHSASSSACSPALGS